MPSKKGFNTQGWKQFLTYRKEILDTYDRAKEKAEIRKVQTYHGEAVEAKFREFLNEFLPNRFGVTAGFIISQGAGGKKKAPHFDVIIYDALNAPTLWVYDNPDSSSQGKDKAIPAEHVFGVLEIKSSFNPTTVSSALEHLEELIPLMEKVDDPKERYKKFFPSNFFCAVVFCEIREKSKRSKKAFNDLAHFLKLRRFYGGIILRKPTKFTTSSCLLKPLPFGDKTTKGSMDSSQERNLFEGIWSTPIKIGEHYVAMGTQWAESHFAQFSFDLISLMNGTFRHNQLSSWHGIGTSSFEEE